MKSSPESAHQPEKSSKQVAPHAGQTALKRAVTERSFLGLKPNTRSFLALDLPAPAKAKRVQPLHYRSAMAEEWQRLYHGPSDR